MKLINRYLYREYTKSIAYCLTTFIALFLITDLFGHLSKYIAADTPKYLLLKLYVFRIASVLEFIVPACLMLSTLYTLWQLSRHNELIAMRATGISILGIMKPFIVVGICFSLGMVVMKEYVTPHTGRWMEIFSDTKYDAEKFYKVMNLNLRHFPYANTDEHRQWRITELNLNQPEKLQGVTVVKEAPDGTRIQKISADTAEWLDGQWWFHNVLIQNFDKKDNPVGQPYAPIPGDDTIMQMTELNEQPSDFTTAAKRPEFLTSGELLHYLKTHKFLPKEEKAKIRVDFHSRLALPWACLIATLFAIPVGAKSSRQSVLTNIFMAIGYLFLFYATIQFGNILGKKQVLSPWLGAWLSNILFFASGCVMTKKII